jgi:hypothetical protein
VRAYSLARWHDEPLPLKSDLVQPKLLRPGAAARYVGISTPMLGRYRRQAGGPDYVLFGRNGEAP